MIITRHIEEGSFRLCGSGLWLKGKIKSLLFSIFFLHFSFDPDPELDCSHPVEGNHLWTSILVLLSLRWVKTLCGPLGHTTILASEMKVRNKILSWFACYHYQPLCQSTKHSVRCLNPSHWFQTLFFWWLLPTKARAIFDFSRTFPLTTERGGYRFLLSGVLAIFRLVPIIWLLHAPVPRPFAIRLADITKQKKVCICEYQYMCVHAWLCVYVNMLQTNSIVTESTRWLFTVRCWCVSHCISLACVITRYSISI